MNNYDFYIAKKDIPFTFGEGKEKITVLLEKGEILLRVGYGLVHPKLPTISIEALNYIVYKRNDLIEKIEDKDIIKNYTKEYSYIIETITTDMTTQFLTIVDQYKEFIKVPSQLETMTLNKIKEFFINEK